MDFLIHLERNGITCLLGASGSGKSTLLNLLAGFDREYSGKILVDGQVLSELSDEELCEYRKHTIGFVFQEYHLLTGYTVLENILLAAELTCQDNAQNREWALSLLRRLNIEEKANEENRKSFRWAKTTCGYCAGVGWKSPGDSGRRTDRSP